MLAMEHGLVHSKTNFTAHILLLYVQNHFSFMVLNYRTVLNEAKKGFYVD